MDDAVQTTPTDQGASVSQTDKVSQDTQIAKTSVDNTSESTREVANTPEVKEATQEPAQEQTTPTRSEARQRELANRLRDAEMQNARLRAAQVSQPQQTQYNPNIPNDEVAVTQIKYRQDLLEAQLQIRDEQSQWAEAEAEYPELRSDKEIDDAAYDIYLAAKSRGETIHPREAVKRVKKLLSRAENAGMAKAENAIEAKSSAGVGVRRSETNSTDDSLETEIREAKKLARSNGLEGAYRFLKATGM
jgi:hypothetical protein